MRKYISLIVLLLCVSFLWAVDKTYYSTYIDNKSGATLFTGIHNVAKVGYSSLSYSGLWTAYATTDVYPTGHADAGKIWDMYGGCTFAYGSKQCGQYSSECDCYNREHSIPKSWFGSSEASNTPGSDIFHVVPTDGKVNGMRSNYAFGEVNTASYSYNGSQLGTPKSITIANTLLGSGEVTKSCGSTPVFEPIDEYKGDFARGYFGTMVRWASGDYQTFTSGDGAQIFNTAYDAAHYYGLTQYGLALLLKWHRQDPVSQKEIDRNNGIQTTQGNRNPFIDYPILAEYLWGKYAGQTFSQDNAIGSFEAGFTLGVSDGDKNGSTPTPSYTVTWMANGSSFSTATTRPADDPDDCSSTRVFRGWTGIADYSGNTAPSDLFTTGNPTITKDTTFYAVYANKSTSGSGDPTNVALISEFDGQGTSGTGSEMTATKSGVTLTFSKAFGASTTVIRAYAGGTFTFTSSSPITQISFTTNSQKGNAADVALTSGGGSYSATGTSGAWTGSSTSIVFSNSEKQVQFTGITVTIRGSVTTYSNFSLTCETGSTIYGVDPSYYESLEGKSDSQLRSALTVFLYNNHTLFDKYGGTGTQNWDFPFDYDENGEVWDIYTQNCHMTNTQGSSGSCCCTGLNREHLVCQSTFGGSDNTDKIPQYCDRHHLFLTDARTNQIRSDQAFGECDPNATTTTIGNGTSCTNCTDHALGRKGKVTTFAELYDSDEDIYEPGDEYKGDIARAVLYMVVRYAEQQYCRLPDDAQYCEASGGGTIASDHSLKQANEHYTTTWKNKGAKTALTIGQMFSTSLDVNYGLSAYGDSLLLKWHRQDPVSKKEIDRNAGVEAVQGNRNPFVDCPDLVEYLWGTKQGESFSVGSSGEIPTPTPVETKYTITWNVKGETTSDQVSENTQPTAPSVSDCSESRVFKGWTTTSTVSGEAPTPLYAADDIPNATTNATYYAVFADKETIGGSSTESVTFSSRYSENTVVENTPLTIGTNSTVTFKKGSTNTQYYTTGYAIRWYGGGTCTITTSSGNISQIVFTYGSSDGSNEITSDVGTFETNTWKGSASTVVFTQAGATGNRRIAGISVTISTGSVTTYSNYGLACPSQVPEYTVILNDNGSEISTTGTVGTPVVTDDPEPCKETYSFVGWSTTQYTTPTTTAPSVYASNAIPAISADATYYAVYSQVEEGDPVPTNNYRKITTTSELTDANYLIVADTTTEGDLVALTTTWKGYYLAPSVKLTSVNDTITIDGDTIIWQITKGSENSQITIHNADSGYFYIKKSTSGTKTYYNIKLGNNTTDNKFTYSVSNGAWILTSVTYSNRQLEYYKSSQRWAIYTSQDAPIYLYKQLWTPDTVTTYTTAPDCSDPGTTTDLEETQLSPQAQKLLINGQLFILRGNTLYDITGQRVR